MARKPDSRQIAFDFEGATVHPASPTASVDMVQQLIDAGFIPDGYRFDIDGNTLRDPDVPYVPRSISFPCSVVLCGDEWKLLLRTPSNGSLPFVKRVATVTGLTPEWKPSNDRGQWHHAVDLATDDGIDRLLGTLDFTTVEMAARGIRFGVECGVLSLANARRGLLTLGIAEPADRSAAFLAGEGMAPCAMMGAPNIFDRADRGRAPWAQVHAIEDGWVTRPVMNSQGHVSRYSVVTAEGWRRRGVEHSGKYAKAA